MGKLIYSAITSVDGYVADRDGGFDWAAPDPEVHRFVNDLERPVGTYLYGRRMYEVMTYWETAEALPGSPEANLDYAAVWQQADKIVFSTSLAEASTRRTRVERRFDPAEVRDLVRSAPRDVSIGGPELAAHALRGSVVDELVLILVPVVVGGGTAALPDDVRLELELADERRFGNGTVYLRYRIRR